MKYNELRAIRQKKGSRVGRGIAAGQGKTAGRGTKGQGARKSGGVRPGFEGGQMPLYMRLPKLRGFKSHKTGAEVVYTGQLEAVKLATINNDTLYKQGLISSPNVNVKLLLRGDLSSKKDIKLQLASQSAIAAVTKAGGSFTISPRTPRTAVKKSKNEAA